MPRSAFMQLGGLRSPASSEKGPALTPPQRGFFPRNNRLPSGSPTEGSNPMRLIAATAVALVILGVAAVASAAGTQDGGPLIVGKDTNYEHSSTVLSNE